MKRHLKFFYLLSIIVLVVSCDKEPSSKSFDPFYKLTVNGSKKTVDACGTSDHVAAYLKDTAVFADFGCGEQRAGFYLKGRITDGTYQLDHKNRAWYDQEPLRYITDSLHKGTLTIRSGNYQATGGSIPYIEGEIYLEAIDKNTGQTIRVTDGKYLLKKYQF